MVHALSEAWRVLKPNSLLVDLRPAIKHYHAGILRYGRYRRLGTIPQTFDLDRAASRAVGYVLARKLFRHEWRTQFEYDTVFATLGAFREWLSEFIASGGLPANERLVRQVDDATSGRRSESRIVARGALMMRVLRREGTSHGGRAQNPRRRVRPASRRSDGPRRGATK